MTEIIHQGWDEWLEDQKTNPNRAVHQLMRCGVGLDAAVIAVMIGRVYDQLLDLETLLREPPEDWKQ